ncbi:MAG: hypothetical protein M0024_10175 [Nitrospiraceae bacterium]|nr:hypothetical protein [Nitrospiraceae bacterium]
MRIEDRLNKLEKKIPLASTKRLHSVEELKAIAETMLTKTDDELKNRMFTPDQLRKIATQYLRSRNNGQ